VILSISIFSPIAIYQERTWTVNKKLYTLRVLNVRQIKNKVLYNLGEKFLRKQQTPEGRTTSQSKSSMVRKANAANSARQKQANTNRSKKTQADNSRK
jgi:hypothetical protein